MHIIGYTYEADAHCQDCAHNRFHRPHESTDNEGNPVHPMFSTDEYLSSEYCGTCGREIYHVDPPSAHDDPTTERVKNEIRANFEYEGWTIGPEDTDPNPDMPGENVYTFVIMHENDQNWEETVKKV